MQGRGAEVDLQFPEPIFQACTRALGLELYPALPAACPDTLPLGGNGR